MKIKGLEEISDFRMFTPEMLVILWFVLPPEGLESSGRRVGRISTNFRRIPFGGFRAMTKKPKMLTTKKATTIYM